MLGVTPCFVNENVFVDTRLGDRHNPRFPNLMRLHLDFGFRIVEQFQAAQASSRYLLTSEAETPDDIRSVAPAQQSLEALEQFVRENMTDLLYNYLFDGEIVHGEPCTPRF